MVQALFNSPELQIVAEGGSLFSLSDSVSSNLSQLTFQKFFGGLIGARVRSRSREVSIGR